jgi:acetoin utilization deacetylase AcuC-like enzyme
MSATSSHRTGLVLDARFQGHLTGPGHPERPERLARLIKHFHDVGLTALCTPVEPRDVAPQRLELVHDPAYLHRLETACANGHGFIDHHENAVTPQSYRLAREGVGAILAAVDGVISGELRNAFCAVRPPGHHCERSLAMGFCLLANVAIAARYLREQHGVKRVAIVDWDVHHGNGTQHLLEDRDDALVISLHGHPAYLYPGTGFAEERGRGAGEGTTLNIPLYPGAGDDDFRRAFDTQVLPLMDDYAPEFVLISAGFDAHRRDPLGPLQLESESYAWMTRALCDLARRHARGRVVSVLEGGYDLTALAESAEWHVRELLRAVGEERSS